MCPQSEIKDDHLIASYKSIISLFCGCNITEEQFELLKNDFKSDIDSVRTFDIISNLEELFQVLERRNVIGVYKIYRLFDIAKKITSNRRIAILLNHHAKLLSKRSALPAPCMLDLNLLTDYIPVLPDPVVDYISTNITINWKQFARALQIIPESDIDFIETKYEDLEEKTRQVLERYVHESRLQRLRCPYTNILSALDSIKRRDLKEKVEEMFNQLL